MFGCRLNYRTMTRACMPTRSALPILVSVTVRSERARQTSAWPHRGRRIRASVNVQAMMFRNR